MDALLLVSLGMIKDARTNFNYTCMLENNGVASASAQQVGQCLRTATDKTFRKCAAAASPPADKTSKKILKTSIKCYVLYSTLLTKAIKQTFKTAKNATLVFQQLRKVRRCLARAHDYNTCGFTTWMTNAKKKTSALYDAYEKVAPKYDKKCKGLDVCNYVAPKKTTTLASATTSTTAAVSPTGAGAGPTTGSTTATPVTTST